MKSLICCALVALAYGSSLALAGDCCQHCGCQCACQKVCRLVCETKKVTKVDYDCECEDFCVPGPSERTRVRRLRMRQEARAVHAHVCRSAHSQEARQARDHRREAVVQMGRRRLSATRVPANVRAQTAENRAQQAAAKPHSTGDAALASHEAAQRPSPSVSTLASQSLTAGLNLNCNRVLGRRTFRRT